MTGIVILGIAVGAALGFGLYRRTTDGGFSAPSAVPTPRPTDEPSTEPSAERTAVTPAERTAWARIVEALPAVEQGERATLVQFSSAFCAPCRATRVVLADIAEREPGVAHVEVDAEQHLALVRALDVRRTPTTLILDRAGAEVVRAAGAPRREQVLAALPADPGQAR